MTIRYVPPISVTSKRLILDNEKLRRANAKVPTATAFKYGDLLTLSDDNVLSHATDEKTWDVICGQDVTAAEATIKAADGIEIPVYYGGVFSIEAVSLNGTLLTPAQYDAARAKATKNKIELSKGVINMPQSFNLEGTPLELLDVGELALIHSNYRPMDTWLLDKLFPNRPLFTRDDVPLAEVSAEHDLAPLVSPQQPGKPFDTTQSGEVRHVKPAYYKPKNQVTPAETFEIALLERLRTAGIISTGNQRLSEQEQMIIAQISVMKRNHDAIDNSVLMMAIDLLKNGKYALHSDDYEYNLVDYRRDASLTFTPLTKWNEAGAKPVTDIRTMLERQLAADGGEAKLSVMSGLVWAALWNNEEFKKEFITPYAGISVPVNPSFGVKESATFKGTFDGVEFWVYDATYRNKGKVNRFIPKDYFSLISDTNGSVAHCKIKNMLANGVAQQYFDRQWYCEDPSGIMLMTESAPLVVPSNKNGVVGGTGFITL